MNQLSKESPEPWFIIINPTSGGGKGNRKWPKIKQFIEQSKIEFDFAISKRKGHIEEITQAKIAEGFRKFIIVGGDGSLHGFVNGAFSQREVSTSTLTMAMISLGTGNDWVRSEGIPGNMREVIEAIKTGNTKSHDVGCIHHDHSKTYFINMAGFGFDAFVLDAYYRIGGWYIGKIKYIYALAISLFRYKMQTISMKISGQEVFNGRFYNMNVGIGKFAGGGMKMTPKAENDDKQFDVTLIADVPKWKVILNVPRLFTGAFTTIREATEYRSDSIMVEGDQLLLEADGEELGRASRIIIKTKEDSIKVIVDK